MGNRLTHAIVRAISYVEVIDLIYEQNVYWKKINYISDRFWYEFNWISGIREESDYRVDMSPGNNLFDKIDFFLDDKRIEKLKKYLKIIKRKVREVNLDFDAVLYLHNEVVMIDKRKRDDRSFGFIRILVKKMGITIYTEDIPVLRSNLFELEELINIVVRDCCKKYCQIGAQKEKKMFVNIPHILSSKAAGFFIHEIIGHLLEYDYYSVFKEQYKDLKISPLLTVVDSVNKEINVAGTGKYDDDGNETKSVVLIKNGKINNLISIDKSVSFDKELYGFARRTSFKDSVLPRMRNTYIQSYQKIGKYDILNKYQEAIYIEEANLGIVNYCSGEFKLYGNGFVVRNGIIQNYINELCVYGNILKDISMVEYVGNDFKIYGGYCGKMGQSVHVGYGGPTISLSEMTSEGVIYERR